MKKLILLLLLFSSVAKANIPNWPTQLFSDNQVYQYFLLPFQNYFRDINRDYVVINPTPDVKIIRSSKYLQYYFKIVIQRTFTEDSITEVLNYSVRDIPSGRIFIIRTGPNLLPTPNSDLFSFRLPLPSSAEKFQLTFENGFGLKMNFSNLGNIHSGNMTLFNGEAAIYFNETIKNPKFITRTFWFTCSSCDSTSLIANAQEVGPDEWQYIYKTSKGDILTSQDFYTQYERYYLPPITMSFNKILDLLIDNFDWP